MNICELYFKQDATKKEKIIEFFHDFINHNLTCAIFILSIVASFFTGLFSFITFIVDDNFSTVFLYFKISFVLFVILLLSYYCFDVKFKEYFFLRNKRYLNFLQNILLSKFNFDLKKQMDDVAEDVEKIDIILDFLDNILEDDHFLVYPSSKEIRYYGKIYSFKTLNSIVKNKGVLIRGLSKIKIKTMETEIIESSNVLKQKVDDLKDKEELKKFSKLLE